MRITGQAGSRLVNWGAWWHSDAMGLLCDYFVASDDEEAVRTIDWVGGPTCPPDGVEAPPALGLEWIEPFVVLGQLEECVTGRSYAEISRSFATKIIANRDDGERLVIRVDDAFVADLSASGRATLELAASKWSTIEELQWLSIPLTDLTHIVISLAALSLEAAKRSHHVYCWMCV